MTFSLTFSLGDLITITSVIVGIVFFTVRGDRRITRIEVTLDQHLRHHEQRDRELTAMLKAAITRGP